MTISRRTRHLTALGTGAAVLALYLPTLAPTVGFIDSGELAATAWTFGIAHPTGYPLFTLLAGAWAHLPLGSSAVARLNTLSALWCAGAVVMLFHLIWTLTGVPAPDRSAAAAGRRARKTHDSRPRPPLDEPARLLVSAFGALAIGWTETFWSSALAIEVYSLHLLLIALVLWLFARAVLDPPADPARRRRWWLGFAVAAGLAFTNHMSTVLLAPACLALLVWRTGWTRSLWEHLRSATPAFATGLLPYLYLPLRASTDPPLNWGSPDSLWAFVRHVSGTQYRVWMFSGAEAATRQLGRFIASFPEEFAYALLPLILLGAWAAFRRQRPIGWLLALLFGACVLYAINYDIHDIDSYFLLAYIVGGIWAAWGLGEIALRLGQRRWLAAALGGALLLGAGGFQFQRVSQRGNFLVEDYTRNMFRSLRPGAIVLSAQWDYWVSAAWYYQLVEGWRPDVAVIDPELLRRSWYLEQLRRQHPEIYHRSGQEIRAFLPELAKFEHDRPYDPSEIEARYSLLIRSFIDRNIAERPVYATFEVASKYTGEYRRVPEGLAFRLYPPGAPPSPDAPVWDEFDFRPFRRDSDLADNLVDLYGSMLANRGVFLHEAGRHDAAGRYFKRALRFSPDSSTIREWQALNEDARRVPSP